MAEGSLVRGDRHCHLRRGVLGVAKPRRQRHARSRLLGHLRVDEQRQDRVVIRGRRQLHLAALGEPSPGWKDPSHDRDLEIEEAVLLVFGIAPPLALELVEERELPARGEAEPCEVEEHLQVTKLAVREVGRLAVRRGVPALLEQVPVAGARPYADLGVDGEEVPQDEAAVLVGEQAGGLARERPGDVPCAVLDVGLELLDEDGDEVHRAGDLGMVLEHPRHVVVGPGRVQANPWEDKALGERVPIVGLMHMPVEDDVHRRIQVIVSRRRACLWRPRRCPPRSR